MTLLTHNSLLDQMLQNAMPPAWLASLERVVLQTGALRWAPGSEHVYFPQDALLTLSQIKPAHDAVDVAVVGRHACIGPAELWGTQMQASVMVPGHAYRLDWARLKQDKDLYGRWLWHTTAVTHGLIEQMAQTAFCARHHNATQRLASWFLMCLSQYGGSSLRLSLDVLPASLRQRPQAMQTALDVLQNQQAIEVQEAAVHVRDAQRLAGVACRCHSMVMPPVVEPRPPPL
ncbi:MAG: Crp/Fnr family transcriptional regulator [Limnohabitans sp.]